MNTLDWIILLGTLGFIVGYGAWKNRKNESITDYLKGGNSARWWTIGLSCNGYPSQCYYIFIYSRTSFP
jgi:Na+/proline symporter